MSLTLYTTVGNLRAAKIEIVAEHLKVQLQFNWIDHSQMKSPEYLKKHPLGKVPLLDTPEGPIYESNAILRYLARKQKSLYGSNVFETAQVDQWLDFQNNQSDPFALALMSQYAGWAPLNKDLYNDARKGVKEAVKVLENHLKGRKFLVGESVTIADIAIVTVLSIPFRLLFDEKTRQTIPSVTEWYMNVSSLPAFQSVLGKTWLCEKEYDLHFPEEAKHVEAKKEKKDEEKKEEKKDVRKDAGKKEEKKQVKKQDKKETKKDAKKETKKEEPKKKKKESDDEQEEEETDHLPKKKANPLDGLPPTPFKLDDFKRQISNAPDRSVVLKEFWPKYDPQGWSLWKVTYQKYEGEGVVDYLTANLMNGFIRNLDHFRKYAFAGYGVYGTPGHYDIKGVWLWRGTEIPEEWKEHQSFEYHNFEKLDHNNEAHRKLVEQYWINTKEGDLVEGQPVYEARHFK